MATNLSHVAKKKDIVSEQQPKVEVVCDKAHIFEVRRYLDPRGQYIYVLGNKVNSIWIEVPRDLYDRFRATVRAMREDLNNSNSTEPKDRTLRYAGLQRYHFKYIADRIPKVAIVCLGPDEQPESQLEVVASTLAGLVEALYHSDLQHSSDLLDRIVSYHRLFAMSFVEHSDSLTGGLILRKDILCHHERYSPALGLKNSPASAEPVAPVESSAIDLSEPKTSSKRRGAALAVTPNSFRSRLGEREEEKSYRVDYDELFGASKKSTKVETKKLPPSGSDSQSELLDGTNYFPVPLSAAQLKQFSKVPFTCDFSPSEVRHLRKTFLSDRDADYFLGFEILDCVYRVRTKLKSFRFPLYYLPIRIVESGRDIILHPLTDSRVFLNHFALVQLFDVFSPANQTAKWTESFLQSLLTHQFEIDGLADRIRLQRWLPCSREVFENTRELLLGLPGESGKGGLLADLKFSSIECDLECVYLYKVAQGDSPSSPIARALEDDLRRILRTVETEPVRYYKSLLGRFLAPETQSTESENAFSNTLYMHGALPKSVRTLMARLNEHDLVLVEGPPGTGKTYNIANLLIHCVTSGKKLAVVSDQEAAVHALMEQIQSYVVGPDKDGSEARGLEQLWRFAIKVVDQLPSNDLKLATWARQLRQMLALDAMHELDWPHPVENYEKRLQILDQAIEETTERLNEQLCYKMGISLNRSHSKTLAKPKVLMPRVARRSEHGQAVNEFR